MPCQLSNGASMSKQQTSVMCQQAIITPSNSQVAAHSYGQKRACKRAVDRGEIAGYDCQLRA